LCRSDAFWSVLVSLLIALATEGFSRGSGSGSDRAAGSRWGRGERLEVGEPDVVLRRPGQGSFVSTLRRWANAGASVAALAEGALLAVVFLPVFFLPGFLPVAFWLVTFLAVVSSDGLEVCTVPIGRLLV
jgi:hypothetical protein